MNKKIIYRILTAFSVIFFISSCADERYLMENGSIGEGEAVVSAEFIFKNFSPALDTRTPGNALNGIENLYIFVYTTDGILFKRPFVYSKNDLNIDKNSYVPSDGEGVDDTISDGSLKDDAKTEKASVKSGFSLPFGKYHIYAAANIRGEYAAALSDPEGVVKTEDGLKSYQVSWNGTTTSDNDQMFGYFMVLHDDATFPSKSKGFGPETVVINKPNMRISAWMRRLASKVTVAYDASGLNEGVWVYIKNVTVHDIAAKCYLGKDNDPNQPDMVLNRRTGNDNQPGVSYTPSVPNTRITYPGTPSENIYDKTQSGLELYKGLVTPSGTPIILGSHTSTSDALFFYENMQGNFKDDPDYDKRQQGTGQDQVGDNIREEKDGNDYKDRVPLGTYVEVEAYYISINPENPTQGSIKYRFMLGKDIFYDYDVERNYHYKLTLGFKGWANQPDWHIDYDIPDPNLEVPPVYRVSYLYQQKSSLPVKISQNCKSLRVDIIENNWAPSDPNNLEFPAATISSAPNTYQFTWNRAAFNSFYSTLTTVEGISVPVNTARPWLGFLALNMPYAQDVAELPVTVPEKTPANPDTGQPANYWSFKDRLNGQVALEKFYDASYGQGSQAYSEFKGTDLEIGDETKHPGDCPLNSWSVVPVDDGTGKNNKIVMVPLWTRAKTMIEGSGFSGNNPYEYFVRKATLKITAVYDMGENTKDKTLTEYVTVLQEPRIVNPKAIWRKGGSGASKFHVVLMTTLNSNAQSDYSPLRSDGQWTASVEMGTNVTLSTSETTLGEEKDGKIYGITGSEVDFNINIDGDGCAIVNVLYHNNNCTHKIFVNQGYEGTVSLGGNQWSNYTLESATASGTTNVYDAVETSNPMILGSLFRRGRITEGILETNNNRENFGPFKNPGTTGTFNLTGGGRKTWDALGCEGSNDNPAPMGTFRIKGVDYKVPELDDFNKLKANCEFALGVLYGDGATETSDKFATATGYWSGDQDPNKGVRCVIAYDAKNGTGHQVVFPLGKDGFGRRKQSYYNNPSNVVANGTLMYSDVWSVLSGSTTESNNTFRPVPYNLKIVPGIVLWLNNRVANGFLGDVNPGPTMSWDINYFNYDFNSFDNGENQNYRDACAIKLIRQ